MEKNIIVTDFSGRKLGMTYEKRAEGLVKNKRAKYLNDHTIQMLSAFDRAEEKSDQLFAAEENKMSEFDVNKKENVPDDTKIYFNAREWSVCSESSSVAAERTFVTDFENNLSEAYCIGNKSENVTEIATKQLTLKPNTKYEFYFWAKMDLKYDSMCQLQIIYNGDFENKRVYILSNTNIKPVKISDGWRLYKIPFITEDNENTQLKFYVKAAKCTIVPGKEEIYYKNLPNDDEEIDNVEDTANEAGSDTEENKPFKNIADSFKEFFGQNKTESKNQNSEKNRQQSTADEKKDPFQAFNDFTQQIRQDIRREVNRSVRNDIYSDLKNMKDDIVNEIKNTFSANDNNKDE